MEIETLAFMTIIIVIDSYQDYEVAPSTRNKILAIVFQKFLF